MLAGAGGPIDGAVRVWDLSSTPASVATPTRALRLEGGVYAVAWGEGGRTLKAIGTQARRELERGGGKVFLKLWVRVKDGWNDDPRALQQFGYGE